MGEDVLSGEGEGEERGAEDVEDRVLRDNNMVVATLAAPRGLGLLVQHSSARKNAKDS